MQERREGQPGAMAAAPLRREGARGSRGGIFVKRISDKSDRSRKSFRQVGIGLNCIHHPKTEFRKRQYFS